MTAPHRAALIVALLIAAGPAAATEPPVPGPLCSPTVSAALSAWDMGLATAAKFGDRAVAVARETGRELLLPLLGIDPGTLRPDTEDGTSGIGRALEATRQNPEQRFALCIAITEAVEEAKASGSAGLDALKRALERFGATPPATPPVDVVPTGSGDLIRT